ncbi:unnamed protein product [Caenorhabditis brenneri]
MRTCLSLILAHVMALTIGLRDYLKTTRVGKCFLSVFGYIYVRWRVMRSTSPESEGEFDSHDSSYYEAQAQRRKITRTKSVYNAACPNSLRDCKARQKPTCIEIYRQFMNYGSTDDDIISGHIFLSNSASYYATPNVTLCQVSLLGSEDYEDESIDSQSQDVEETNEFHSESSPTKEEIESCHLYQNWIPPVRVRRILPITPIETPQNPSSSQKFVQNSYEYYENMPSRSIEFVTYPEVGMIRESADSAEISQKQRRVNNYFFTKPMFFENNELRMREEDRKARKIQRKNIIGEQPYVAKWVESESFNLRTESMSSELASTVLQEQSDSSHSSDYRTVSISSPVGKEVSNVIYWKVERCSVKLGYRKDFPPSTGTLKATMMMEPLVQETITIIDISAELAIPIKLMSAVRLNKFFGVKTSQKYFILIRRPEHQHGLIITGNVRMIYDYYGLGKCSKMYYIGE